MRASSSSSSSFARGRATPPRRPHENEGAEGEERRVRVDYGVLRDAVSRARPGDVHGVHRALAAAWSGGRRGAHAARLRSLLPPRLRAGDALERAAKVREAAVPQLPRHARHRTLRQAFGATSSASQEAYGEHERAHLRLRGEEERDVTTLTHPPPSVCGCRRRRNT